ncbi:MAG: hypothetical protein PVJ01_03260 [Pseudomonadota bacterium]|jgi:hypothetical protein
MALSFSVLLLSASILSFEIIVIRLLAISHWQPFVTLAISTALLGYGLSGSILGRFRQKVFGRRDIFYPALAAAAVLMYRPVIFASAKLHLDPGLIIRDPYQWLKIGFLVGVLTLPFTAASGALALPLLERSAVGRYYGWNFVGAAIGVLAALAGLAVLRPEYLSRIPVLFAGLAVLTALIHFKGIKANLKAGAAVVAALAMLYPSSRPVYGPYKDISYALRLPGAAIRASRAGITGLFQVVTAPALRSAAGLSTRYRGSLPEQAALYHSGDRAGTVVLAAAPDDEGLKYLDWQTAAAPYAICGKDPMTAIVGFDGGEEAARAFVHGLSAAVIVEPDPGVEALIKENPDLFKRWIFSPGAAVIERDNARSHFARGSADYDLIVYPAGINLASAAAGLTGTAESYEITLQGIEAALANLKKTGMIAITGWNRFPPTGRWKLLALLGRIKALDEGKGFSGRVYLVEGWSNYTILVRREPFTDNQLKILSDFCSRRGFNLIDSDRFPAPDERLPSREKALVDYLDLRPPVDSRPYPWHSLRLSYLEKLTGGSRESAFPRVEWGFFFLTMVLAVTTILALAALILSRPRGGTPGGLYFGLYFACLGTGYMTMEILLIKRAGLVMGPPAVTAGVLLFSFMLGSGLGSLAAGRRMNLDRQPVWVFPAVAALTAAAYFLTPYFLKLTIPAKFPALFLTAAVPAFLMGFPFPSALMLYETDRESLLTWAWALNGYSSVIGSSLAGVLAVTLGFESLLLLGTCCYMAAWGLYGLQVKKVQG